MTVVPRAGMDWSPPLGSGATDLCGLALAVDPALLVAVDAAVADDAGTVDGTAPPEPLLARGALDPEPAAGLASGLPVTGFQICAQEPVQAGEPPLGSLSYA